MFIKEGKMFMYFVFAFGWLFGTALSLRLIKLNGNPYNLTIAGKLVVAGFFGLLIGLFITFLDGLWWNCDGSSCSYDWGY